jgi:hypothetical protein
VHYHAKSRKNSSTLGSVVKKPQRAAKANSAGYAGKRKTAGMANKTQTHSQTNTEAARSGAGQIGGPKQLAFDQFAAIV